MKASILVSIFLILLSFTLAQFPYEKCFNTTSAFYEDNSILNMLYPWYKGKTYDKRDVAYGANVTVYSQQYSPDDLKDHSSLRSLAK